MASYIFIKGQTSTLDLAEINSTLKLNTPTYNVLEIRSEEGKSISIDKAKEITRFISKKPMFGDNKLVVVFDSHKLTTEAQNALLKTLEDHPDFVNIVLISKSESGLLDTVLSRCKKIRIDKTTSGTAKKVKDTLSDVLSTRIGDRGGLALKLSKKDKNEVIEILSLWLYEANRNSLYDNAEHIISSINDLENTNVSVRLSLEVLLFKLK